MFNHIRYVTMIGGAIPKEIEITRLVDDLILPAMQQLGR
ncbi:putative transcriptional regulator [Levilactobacillus brevis]|nr:putative transcriptional regulator [Levilactobacillus brevis]